MHENKQVFSNGLGIAELTNEEIDCVGGGDAKSAGAIGLAAGIGAATWGSTWGALAVGTAFAAAPFAVIAMGGLALYAGYRMLK